MTLALSISYGCIQVDVVCIVGLLMNQQGSFHRLQGLLSLSTSVLSRYFNGGRKRGHSLVSDDWLWASAVGIYSDMHGPCALLDSWKPFATCEDCFCWVPPYCQSMGWGGGNTVLIQMTFSMCCGCIRVGVVCIAGLLDCWWISKEAFTICKDCCCWVSQSCQGMLTFISILSIEGKAGSGLLICKSWVQNTLQSHQILLNVSSA